MIQYCLVFLLLACVKRPVTQSHKHITHTLLILILSGKSVLYKHRYVGPVDAAEAVQQNQRLGIIRGFSIFKKTL